MKLPICSFCAKTGMLCANCKTKLQDDDISNLDVEISKILVKHSNVKSFQNVKFFNSIDTPELLIISGDKALKQAISSSEQIKGQIERLNNKSVQIVAKEGTVKDTLSSLFSPVEVSGIDEIFVPDGTKEIRVNLRGKVEDLPLQEESMLLIASKLTDSSIRIEFVN